MTPKTSFNVVADLASLSPLERVLLASDGSLTAMLEAACLDRIRVRKLAEDRLEAAGRIHLLSANAGDPLIKREVLLESERSRAIYVHAESIIAANRLPAPFIKNLLQSDEPLGRLWKKYDLNIYKEKIALFRQSAGLLARHFGVAQHTCLAVRTSRVFVGAKPAMLINESFSPVLAESLAADSGHTGEVWPVGASRPVWSPGERSLSLVMAQ